ncbi:MAG: TolC family protein [Bacteroidales bacterium]|nr:TolC family protein [Bacteroidales bacterium]MCM1148016.1 TolC family protein [Bacteroidales bacterium]MCM1206834.1 TolC family protein [Bacillota bacterium]MCM1511028.1 TolC family protein [Clostridium sp.]
MKRRTLTAFISVLSLTMHGQDITSVLRDIERNNLGLQALLTGNKALVYDRKVDNSLDAASVEYSPFFRKGAAGVASSELVVSQEFDFPTLYAARAKAGRLQERALYMEWQAARRDILLAAKLRCLDLVMLGKARKVLQERMNNASDLLVLFEKRMKEGDATSLELNKIRMETMDLRTELLQNETEIRAARQELTALNANRPLVLDGLAYSETAAGESPAAQREEIVGNDAAVRSAEASMAVSEQELRVSGQGWLPRISVGYRRNTEMNEASNGFMVGAAFPIFSNGNKVKAAKARKAAAQLYLDNAKAQAESETDARLQELQRLEDALRVYDLDLMERSLGLLRKAVSAGSMSLIDYYAEADGIYGRWQAYLTLEKQYQVLLATLGKNSL